MSELRFNTDKFVSEIHGMSDLASKFLNRADVERLKQAAYNLPQALRSNSVWAIPESNPLRTKTSQTREDGTLYGTLSFKWDIRRVNPHVFSVVNASTTITMCRFENDSTLISWNNDIGGISHPGCRFHVQLRKLDGNSFDIPRLPTILLTPVDCLDFLLGELFTTTWSQHQWSKLSTASKWTGYIRKRTTDLLSKKAERIEKERSHTPWMAVKSWDLDDPELILGDD